MILTYMGIYLMSYLLASFHFYTASGVLLMAEALVLYIHEYRKTGRIVNASGLYSLSLVGGQGISCLKLSYIQTDWAPMTWICFFLAYIGFRVGNHIEQRRAAAAGLRTSQERPLKMAEYTGKDTAARLPGGLSEKIARCRKKFAAGRRFSFDRLLIMNCALALVSWAAFLLEAKVLGFIPFFVRGVPHAYSVFHISGVHYFTVSCVLCPAGSLIWFMKMPGGRRLHSVRYVIEMTAAAIAALSGFLIPVLCVSRFQLVFALALAVFVWLVIREGRGPIKRKTLIRLAAGCVLILIPAYIVLTIARSHDAEYLKGIFEMKKDYPIVFGHIYIYIANNFDNFDCMVKNLTKHSWGIRQLFPLWALSGLKFVFPQLVTYDYFLTKKELTTLTLFYDAYYDFGVIGVALFAAVLGAAGRCLERKSFSTGDAGPIMLYGQFAIYMALAFFTTWFSNPTTWFYIGVTVVIYVLSYEKDTATGVEIQKNNDLQ